MISSSTSFSFASASAPISNRLPPATSNSVVSQSPNSASQATQNSTNRATIGVTAPGVDAPSNRLLDTQRSPEELADADARAEKEAVKQARESQQLLEDQRKIAELSARDREVRAHEQAHAAVGGTYAGAPRYQTERGPDGVNYAVGGEVSIDVSKAATPQETILKAQIVRRAALAPAEPSPQDRKVAAQATQMEAQARNELRSEQIEASEQAPASGRQDQEVDKAPPSTEPSTIRGDDNRKQVDNVQAQDSSAFSNRANQFTLIASNNSPRAGSLLNQIA